MPENEAPTSEEAPAQPSATMPENGIPNALEVTNDLPDGFQAIEHHNIKGFRVIVDHSQAHKIHGAGEEVHPHEVKGLVELQIIFRTKGPKGSRYHYQQLPRALAEAFEKDEHKNGFLNSEIKPIYPFYRADYDSGLPFKAETV